VSGSAPASNPGVTSDANTLYNDGDVEEQIAQLEDDTHDSKEINTIIEARRVETVEREELPTNFWSMDFNGVVSKEGVEAGVWLHNHRSRYFESHSYKLNFQCTNNVVEYEALMLGLKLIKKFGAK
jgi:hypothetical protein